MAGNMQRVVHLDLKGAPPKIDFLEKVLLVVKSCGGTGVLIEWEDTFPYTDELADIGSHGNSGGDGVYKPEEVQHIFNFIKANGLLPIQLIQTFSHLEFVLKHTKFAKLREVHESPACLCPCKPDSLPLVTAMVEQALNAQPDAEYVHIGADEIWHLGVCPDCQTRIAGDVDGTAVLYLDHIQAVTNYIRSIRPNITILMWDDMLRGIKTDILLRYDLGSKVQPVIWDYSPKEVFHIGAPRWNVYSQLFPRVWAASAFKGASGANQILASTYRYVSNNEAWLNEMKYNAPCTVFAGIILTGWSRYDHYATLCELLPVAMPSLVSCLSLLTKPEDVPIETIMYETLPPTSWPGMQFATTLHKFAVLKEHANQFLNGEVVGSWFNPWQIENGYTNPSKVVRIASAARQFMTELAALQSELALGISTFTGQRSSEEWMKTYVSPIVTRISDLVKAAEAKSNSEPSVSPSNNLYLWNNNVQ